MRIGVEPRAKEKGLSLYIGGCVFLYNTSIRTRVGGKVREVVNILCSTNSLSYEVGGWKKVLKMVEGQPRLNLI